MEDIMVLCEHSILVYNVFERGKILLSLLGLCEDGLTSSQPTLGSFQNVYNIISKRYLLYHQFKRRSRRIDRKPRLNSAGAL